MTPTDPTPNPMTAELTAARLAFEASAALHQERCAHIGLFVPHVLARIRLDPGTNRPVVLDEDGAVMFGLSPQFVAHELKAQYPKYFD